MGKKKDVVRSEERKKEEMKLTEAKRELILAEKALIQSYLDLNVSAGRPHLPLKKFMNELEEKVLTCAMILNLGNQRKVASILGVKTSTLCEKLRRSKQKNILLSFAIGTDQSAQLFLDFAGRDPEGDSGDSS